MLVFVDFLKIFSPNTTKKILGESNFGFMENVLRSLIANPKFFILPIYDSRFRKKIQ